MNNADGFCHKNIRLQQFDLITICRDIHAYKNIVIDKDKDVFIYKDVVIGLLTNIM